MADGGREINDVMNDVKIGGGFRCFLEKNSRMLLIIVAAFLTVIIAFQLNRIFYFLGNKTVQKQYRLLKSRDDKIKFVERYDSYPLAGIVALTLGDACLEKRDNIGAIKFYKIAQKSLKRFDPIYHAKIGLAMAEYDQANPDKFEKELTGIISDKNCNKAFKKRAAALLAEEINLRCIKNSDMRDIDTFVDGLAKFGFENEEIVDIKFVAGIVDKPANSGPIKTE